MNTEPVTFTRGFRVAAAITGALGFVSFCCLVMYYAALLDIWHESGSPDFWAGEGQSSFEWQWLAILFWPMLLFHVMFIATGCAFFVRFRFRR